MSPPSAGGALDASRIYIPLESDQTIALDRKSGDTVWVADVESEWPPVLGDGLVFVAASDEIHALDAATGERRWRVAVVRPVAGAMAFDAGRLLVPMAPDEVMAFASQDGSVAWKRSLGGTGGRMLLSAAAAGIYVSVVPRRVVALSPASGAIMWERPVDGVDTVPAVAHDRVVVGSSATNTFIAFDARSGKKRWSWPVGGDPVGAVGDKDLVFLVSLDNELKAVERGDGHQQWRQSLPTRPTYPPRSFGGLALAIGETPAISAFEAKPASKRATPMGTYEAPATLQGAPLFDPAPKPFSVAIVVIMRDGNVVALVPDGLRFEEAPIVPLTAPPGRQLTREPSPADSPPR